MARGRLPGAVIDQQFRPGTGTPRDFPRHTGVVAKALDIKLFRNAEMIRGAVEGETLPFSGITYTAPLVNTAVPDKARARLYTGDGRSVAQTRWNFTESSVGSNVFDQVTIDPTVFNTSMTYQIDYISDNENLTDGIPVDDIREVLSMGDGPGQVKYREGIDYRFLTTATGPTAEVTNVNQSARSVSAVTASPANSVTGNNTGPANPSITINSSAYTHDYNRHYRLECTAAAGIPTNYVATFRIDVLPLSGGTAAEISRSQAQLNDIVVVLDQNAGTATVTIDGVSTVNPTLTDVPIEFGITVDFAFGTTPTNFTSTDVYSFNGLGISTIELDDRCLNDNQFAETSAVVDVSVTPSAGSMTVNDQSAFTGTANQTYQVECTASNSPTASPNRTAAFRWRTNPKLLALTGTLTATNASAAVVGVGSQFVTEVSAGDFIFFGTTAQAAEVLSVTDNNNLVLVDVFPHATVSGGKALRHRFSTGTISIAEAASTNLRAAMDSGILLDFDFGTSPANFAVGEAFEFTASPARQQYNGKENRNYTLSVTSVATPHSTTASFSGDTASSTFGSHAFAEGNPLVLPNNVVLHCRNMTLTNRSSTVAPADSYELSLSFDGLIDWTLQTQVSETIPTTDIRRDLTGSVTGTVGAYFVLLRKPAEQVVYCRGPASTYTDIPYNTVAGTTIVFFLTNPGVALTIQYRHVGIEPSAGAS